MPHKLSQISYRRSHKDDARAVFDLVSASVARLAPDPYPAEVVATWMSGRSPADYVADCQGKEIWIAQDGAVPVGFSHGVPGEVVRLFVAASQTGKGVGVGLFERALADARTSWDGPVTIEATLNAVPFYKRFGFVEVGPSIFGGRDPELPAIKTVILKG
ncbi:GNAT family N-acetyltransferase [Pseudophaeobacter arcticus]|uniref:GNAT family N-acetyltransferase n=1 Tax=Pseudophaeobacter arcticus TaxID=385492 RepID=UPI003A976960